MLDWGSSFGCEMTWAGRRGELLVRGSLQDLIEEQHAGSSASLVFADVRSMLTYGQRNLISPVSINTHTKHTRVCWDILLNHSCCINTNRWSACPQSLELCLCPISPDWLGADHGSNDKKKWIVDSHVCNRLSAQEVGSWRSCLEVFRKILNSSYENVIFSRDYSCARTN